MLLVENFSIDPYYNLAAKEYFLKKVPDDVVMLWRNDRAVVVGKNQNSTEEIDAAYVEDRKIAVVRRLTGGGAVFHDLGNVNFTIISEDRAGEQFNDYALFTKPVRLFLETLGIRTELSGRNDLLVDGRKFSGNAQARYGGRMLHHGTILFDSNMGDLAGALNPGPLKLESKAVKSTKSRVENLISHLPEPMTVERFCAELRRFFLTYFPQASPYGIGPADDAEIRALVRQKYGTWEWNYGESPPYTFRNVKRFPFGIVDLRMEVVEGRIQNARFFGDFFGRREIDGLERALKGVRHSRDALEDLLRGIPVGEYLSGCSRAELSGLFF